MRTLYRAASFGRPVGPWRTDKENARRDLIEHDLGSYDEWGNFWVTVPGDMQVKSRASQSRAA